MMGEELPAGRELDARVAAEVFGLRVEWGRRAAGGIVLGEGEERFVVGPDGSISELPYYSTDLAASWEVAEHLGRQGYTVDADAWAGGLASIRVRSPVDAEQLFAGESPAVAVCRAAVSLAGQK